MGVSIIPVAELPAPFIPTTKKPDFVDPPPLPNSEGKNPHPGLPRPLQTNKSRAGEGCIQDAISNFSAELPHLLIVYVRLFPCLHPFAFIRLNLAGAN